MKRIIGFTLQEFLRVQMLMLFAVAAFGQSPNTYQITPERTTMLIGESRPFRMVDQNGHAQQKVTWTISDADAFQSFDGDAIRLTPKRAGDFRLTARTYYATAEATIKVTDGPLAPGTVKWSAGNKGCKTTKIIPAVPTANGPDIYEQSVCEDGEYVAAYTNSGVQLWRRKLSDRGTPVDGGGSGGTNYEVAGTRLDSGATSICHSASIGTEQQKIRELLAQRNLSFHAESPGGAWMIEESNRKCRMWFDEKAILVKKQKVYVTE